MELVLFCPLLPAELELMEKQSQFEVKSTAEIRLARSFIMSFLLLELLVAVTTAIAHSFLQHAHDLTIDRYLMLMHRSRYDQSRAIAITHLPGDNCSAPQVDAHCDRVLAVHHSVLSAKDGLGGRADLAYTLITRPNHLK